MDRSVKLLLCMPLNFSLATLELPFSSTFNFNFCPYIGLSPNGG